MKYIRRIAIIIIIFVAQCQFIYSQSLADKLLGAWQSGTDDELTVWISADKYFSAAVYNRKDNTFLGTCGGTWRIDGNELVEVHEFNTIKADLVGQELRSKISLDGNKLTVNADAKKELWTRVDDNTPGKLAGAWLITGRVQDGEVRNRTPGARKTMKILSGTRFQWIAYNSETKEFFGTGGGTYTTKDGKYVETIEFFSRDSTRVGASLEFEFSIEDGRWHHKGFSSKGDPIHEVWSTREMLGI
jgi:hypothetical protein